MANNPEPGRIGDVKRTGTKVNALQLSNSLSNLIVSLEFAIAFCNLATSILYILYRGQ